MRPSGTVAGVTLCPSRFQYWLLWLHFVEGRGKKASFNDSALQQFRLHACTENFND